MIKYELAIPDQAQLFQLYENDGWNDFLKLTEVFTLSLKYKSSV
ncbi:MULTISPECIES: hypothetical protein [Bacillaceae]|nr:MULTISPECIES: hypothetical protein [Bacillaceae]